ncbi:DUF805 domain-containing protein [Halocynthiibacter namhaensis]|uniref:DUF805 domain-containing protein n=1 Tax=Halocynthiibacter namhaensis TaxID=1290553 RepID=UPI00057949CC|nr:DUF805 domain-containing protein [Halocynthiibacter namhaensis]
MSPLQAITTGLRKGFSFKGKATRSEFWFFCLFLSAPFLIGITAALTTGNVRLLPQWLMFINPALMFFTLPAAIRRCRDAGAGIFVTCAFGTVFFGGYLVLIPIWRVGLMSGLSAYDARAQVGELGLSWLFLSLLLFVPSAIFWILPSQEASPSARTNSSDTQAQGEMI